jgi:hypothetical protein
VTSITVAISMEDNILNTREQDPPRPDVGSLREETMNRLSYAAQTPLRTAERIVRAMVFPLALLLCLSVVIPLVLLLCLSAALSLALLLGLSALTRLAWVGTSAARRLTSDARPGLA